MVTTPPARPVDRWCGAGRVCDVVDSGCVDTLQQFLEGALPMMNRHRERGISGFLRRFRGQPRDKSHTAVPSATRLQPGSHL